MRAKCEDTFVDGSKTVSVSFASVLRCFMILLLLCLQHATSQSANASTNAFLERCRIDCDIQRDVVVCGKYRMVRWLHHVAREKEFSYGPLRVIRIPSMNGGSFLPKVPRSISGKNGIAETLRFVRDAAEDLLTKRALVYTVDQVSGARSFSAGPMILDEDELNTIQRGKESVGDGRLFKKKKALILPILILLNLLKLKLLLLPIFLGVHFIKKFLVLGSLIAPSILAHLKICKVTPQQGYPYHAWATAAEAPVDYPTGYGHEDPGWMHRNDIQGHYGYPAHHGYPNPYQGYFQAHRQRR